MSTSYYRFRSPISSVRVEEGPGHDIVTVFESGANSGCLVVTKGAGRTIASFFVQEEEDNRAPMRTHFGGKGVGCVVTKQDDTLTDDTYLVSEYGDGYTVAQISEMAGRGA